MGSDSDDDSSPAAAAHKSNPAYYSGDPRLLPPHLAAALLVRIFPSHARLFPCLLSSFAGAGLLLWDPPSKTVILGCDFNKEWSDFGGKRDKTDRDAWHTASREAVEESLGVLHGGTVKKQKVVAEVRAVILAASAAPTCVVIFGMRACFITLQLQWS
jgi:hypothetical protein